MGIGVEQAVDEHLPQRLSASARTTRPDRPQGAASASSARPPCLTNPSPCSRLTPSTNSIVSSRDVVRCQWTLGTRMPGLARLRTRIATAASVWKSSSRRVKRSNSSTRVRTESERMTPVASIPRASKRVSHMSASKSVAGPGALHLDRDPLAVGRSWRGGPGRARRPRGSPARVTGKTSSTGSAELALDLLHDDGERHRRGVIEQPAQLVADLRGEDVEAQGEELAQLHVGEPHPLEEPAEADAELGAEVGRRRTRTTRRVEARRDSASAVAPIRRTTRAARLARDRRIASDAAMRVPAPLVVRLRRRSR